MTGSKLAVGTVTERRIAAVLAPAKERPFAGFACVFYRCDTCDLVAAVTKRLLAAPAAGTPEVGFAFFNLNGVGGLLGDDWRGHDNPVHLCLQICHGAAPA